MMYNQLIPRKIERYENPVGALGIAVATVYTVFLAKKLAKTLWSHDSLQIKKIPTPDGSYPLLGHLPLLSTRLATLVTKWHGELGPIFRLKMGIQDWIFLGDPEAAHEVLVTKGKTMSDRADLTFLTEFISPNERGIMFVDYNEKWRSSRRLVLQLLSPKSVERFSDVFIQESQRAINAMSKKAKEDPELNPISFVFLASFNVIASAAFGVLGADSVDDPDLVKLEGYIYQAMHLANPSQDFCSFFPYLSFLNIFFQKKKEMSDFTHHKFRPVIARLIQRSRESKEDSLVKKIDTVKEEYQLDDLGIISLLSEILVAGVETSSAGISWAIAILCHHPDVQQKICDETDAFAAKHGRGPTFEERNDLPYFVAFIKECLRYKSPTDFGIPHKATENAIYKDYIVPKGSLIFVNSHTLHFDPNLYEEPEKFRPERFLNDQRSLYATSNGSIKARNNYAFGWGRRICPGIYLAETQMFCVLTKLMSTFTIEPAVSASGEKIYPDFDKVADNGITVGPEPFKVRLVERPNRKHL
ncbi:cytochrome P450 [Sporodiniella umbellata]|nr:cytochrome P450 [Sporodiniella umbellata]